MLGSSAPSSSYLMRRTDLPKSAIEIATRTANFHTSTHTLLPTFAGSHVEHHFTKIGKCGLLDLANPCRRQLQNIADFVQV